MRDVLWVGLALAGLLQAPAWAQALPQTLPGIGAADPRRTIADPAAEPWRSLGRVQTELGGRCTGALIAPRLVLTAAHCLVAPRSRRPVQPGSVHFLLGYRAGAWAAAARVKRYVTGAWDIAAGGPAEADWALLTLAAPIAGAALPLFPGLGVGTTLVLAGYQQDRPEVLLASTGCRILAAGAVILHDCAATRGTSGAPLLARDATGAWGIAGVAVTMARDQARGLAVPVAALPGVRSPRRRRCARHRRHNPAPSHRPWL